MRYLCLSKEVGWDRMDLQEILFEPAKRDYGKDVSELGTGRKEVEREEGMEVEMMRWDETG